MVTHRSVERPGTYSGVDLSSVTEATDGSGVHTEDFKSNTVFIEVTGNSGAVTVNIEASPDNSTWYSLDSKTYTAANGKDVYSYNDHFPYMRTTTTTQSDSTVETTIVGKS